MKNLFLCILFLLVGNLIFAQDKPPDAFPDSATIWAGQSIVLDILANDLSQENHPLIIIAYSEED